MKKENSAEGEKEKDYQRIQDGKTTRPAPSTTNESGAHQHREKNEKGYGKKA